MSCKHEWNCGDIVMGYCIHDENKPHDETCTAASVWMNCEKCNAEGWARSMLSDFEVVE